MDRAECSLNEDVCSFYECWSVVLYEVNLLNLVRSFSLQSAVSYMSLNNSTQAQVLDIQMLIGFNSTPDPCRTQDSMTTAGTLDQVSNAA